MDKAQTQTTNIATRFDPELGVFVISEKRSDGRTTKDTHLAFCYRFAPSFPELMHEHAVAGTLRNILDDLAADPQFVGATVRFGVSANKELQRETEAYLADATTLSDPQTARNAVLRKLALDGAYQLLADSTDNASNPVTHYDLFISGYVPLPATSEATKVTIAITKAILCDLKTRLTDRLFGDRLAGAELNGDGYLALLNAMQTTSSSAPRHERSPHIEDHATDDVIVKRIEINPGLTADKHGFAGQLLFGPAAWLHPRRPTTFAIITSYTFVARGSYSALIDSGKAPLKIVSKLPLRGISMRARGTLAAKQKLTTAAREGRLLVQVDVSAFALGSSEAQAKDQADRFTYSVLRMGVQTGPTETIASIQDVLPLSLPVNPKRASFLLTTDRAAALIPVLGGAANEVSRANGLPLRTEFGHPAYLDFWDMNTIPLTLITGTAGSGKSHLVWAVTSHCLLKQMPVFVVNDNTFRDAYVKALGGEVVGRSADVDNGVPIFAIRKDGASDKDENFEELSLAAAYVSAVVSATTHITDYEYVMFREWLVRTYSTLLHESAASVVGINIPDIYERLETSGIDVPSFRKGLRPFRRGGEFEHYLPSTSNHSFEPGAFLVANPTFDERGYVLPMELRVASYLTMIAMAQRLYANRQEKHVPATVLLERIDNLIGLSPQIDWFLLSIIRRIRLLGCAFIATVRDARLLIETPQGMELAALAAQFIALAHNPESIEPNRAQRLFGISEAGYRRIRMHARPVHGSYAGMAVRIKNQTGLYKLSPGPFAQALWSGRFPHVLNVEQYMRNGGQFTEALCASSPLANKATEVA